MVKGFFALYSGEANAPVMTMIGISIDGNILANIGPSFCIDYGLRSGLPAADARARTGKITTVMKGNAF
jgi:hypothetical protein